MDTKDWGNLEALFASDAVMDFRAASGQEPDERALIHGVQNFISFAREGLKALTTIHHGYMPEITIISTMTAEGIWAMEDIHYSLDKIMHGYGHYHDTYERMNERWQIKTMRLARLRIDSGETR